MFWCLSFEYNLIKIRKKFSDNGKEDKSIRKRAGKFKRKGTAGLRRCCRTSETKINFRRIAESVRI